jgi:RimJ/RimL family protein N-acetyltransferase
VSAAAGASGPVFTRTDDRLGEFALRPVRPEEDVALLHAWVTNPKSAFWLMRDATLDDVRREYGAIAARPDHDAFLGLHAGHPSFLMERYDPATELAAELAGVHSFRAGDVGMHFLVAPTATPIHGFTRAVIRTVMAFLFADPETTRVVVEPDVHNTAVHTLNASVGFEVLGTVSLPHKDALLSTCTRERYEATVRRGHGHGEPAADSATATATADDTRSRS